MRDQRSRDLLEEPGEVYQTGIKPGAVTLTQHLPVQRKARTDVHVPPPPASETFGFIQAYGGDIQMKRAAAFPDDRPTPWMAAEQGTSGSAGQLPYLGQIQQSFGRHDVSSVRAYTDSNAAAGANAMGAEAYAVGDQVAFGGTPSLHTAAHEAAHVVQQRAGVSLKGGVGEVGDPYERHADAVADKVVRGESAESLLDEMAGSGGGGGKAIQRSAAAEAAEEEADEAPLTTESPEAIIAAALDGGHDPDRSSGDVGDNGAGPADAADGAGAGAATAAPGAAPIQKKAIQKEAKKTKSGTSPKSIVKDYVVGIDAARAVPDAGSDVYKASQDLSRATCGSDGDPPGMVDIGGGRKIHQDVKQPLANMLAAAAAQTGKKDAVKIKDALRSLPQQWDIWKRLGLYGLNGGNAAIPGTSNHGTGRAVDLSGDLSWVAQHGGEHGFVNFAGEDWHFDHLSSSGVRGRKFTVGASRKHSGAATAAITQEEADRLQKAYDEAVKAWDEGKTPRMPAATEAAATSAPATTGAASTSTSTATKTAPKPASPPATAEVDVAAGLKPLVGTSVMDDGGYTFILEGDLNFKVTGAPPTGTKAIGRSIKRDDPKLGKSWQKLATKLLQEHPAAVAAAPTAAAPATSSSGGVFSSVLGILANVAKKVTDPVGTVGAMISSLFGIENKPAAETPPDAAEMKKEPAADGAAATPAAGAGPAAGAAGGNAAAGGDAAPGGASSTVSTPGAASGPISAANHQSRESFKQANVPENATTTAIVDSIWPQYNAADHVIGGYLSSGQQYWKINYHWELVLWVCDTAAKLVAEEHKASFTTIATTLRTHTPDPAKGYLDDTSMALVDTSTQEAFDARYLAVRQAKKDLATAIASSGAQSKVTGWKADRFTLSVQNVLPPGDNNKHGKGFSLDIKGDNKRIAETSKKLGATTTYDEKFHVHVEFQSGVSVPSTPPGAPPVQKKGDGVASGDVHQAADAGTSGSAGRLPYLDQIQQSFGRHDVSSVRAYTDANAAAGANAMGAEAYAVGDQVAFGGAPTLHTAAHEAAHVVQQRAGVSLKGGVGQAGDPYERHADAVADKVVRGESAESLLDEMAGSGGGGGARAIQKNDKNQPAVGGQAQQSGGPQPQDLDAGKKEHAQGSMLAFMHELNAAFVERVKGSEQMLLQILINRFEANWFKAKACLLNDDWPVPKPDPNTPKHEDALLLMEALVAMRTKVCKRVADLTQLKIREELRTTAAQGLAPSNPIAKAGLEQTFKAEVDGEATSKQHFNPLAPTGAEKRTSDIDVASNGLNTEIGVRVFNETFRKHLGVEWDPATVFDYNVYAMDWIFPSNFDEQNKVTATHKTDGTQKEIAQSVTPKPEHNVAADAGASDELAGKVQRDRDEVQDESALLHIRRNCIGKEWEKYTRGRLSGVPEGEKAALAEKLQRVDAKHEEFMAEIEEKQAELGKHIDTAHEAAQSAFDDKFVHEALETRARNAIYQERLLKVKAARLHYATLKAKPQKTQEEIELMASLATEVTRALTDAVYFANEVYSTEGATLHATQGIQRVQKAKKDFGVDVVVNLTPAHYMQSFHENVGDSLHSLHHYEDDPPYAAYRAGKYIERMIMAGEALAGADGAALTGHTSYQLLKDLGVKAADVKGSAAGDDPVAIRKLFPEYAEQRSLAPLRAAVISYGGTFPGALTKQQQAAAQGQQQPPAQQGGGQGAQQAAAQVAVQANDAAAQQQQAQPPAQQPAAAQAAAADIVGGAQQQQPAVDPAQGADARGRLTRAFDALQSFFGGIAQRIRGK